MIGTPQAVIFDLDGTLVDSVDLHARAWQEALERFGHRLALGPVRRQIGKGSDELLPALLGAEEARRLAPALEPYRAELFRRAYRARAVPLPGARDLVARVRADGCTVALASSGKPEDVAHYRRLLGIDPFLDAGATSAEDADRSKPHPDLFQAALARTGVPIEAAVAVGDSPWDALSAQRAGLRAVGLCSGAFAEVELRAAGCVAVYRDPADLLARFDASPLSRRVKSGEAAPPM